MRTFQVNFTTKYIGWQMARDSYVSSLYPDEEVISYSPLVVKSDRIKPFDCTLSPLFGTVDFVAPEIWSIVELNYKS
jgi:hypothetical protein